MKTLFTLFLLISVLCAQGNTCIVNFGKEICGNFNVLNGVIVKSKLSKEQIRKKLGANVKQLASLKESNIFLLESTSPVEYAKKLSKQKAFIIYAQPNISQARNLADANGSNIAELYGLDKKWQTTQGQGVKIAIIDDGFNLNHEDLNNTKVSFSYDADEKVLNSLPKVKPDIHGTQVAGVIFASRHGIAPKSELIAIRQTTNITSDTVVALSVSGLAGANVVNLSWNSPMLLEPVYDTIRDLVEKNIAVVVAAGNDAKELVPYATEAGIPEVITVAAKAKYSNYGETVDFVIPSGIFTTKSNGSYGIFHGTSATAPVIAGLIALKLSADKTKSIAQITKELKEELNGN